MKTFNKRTKEKYIQRAVGHRKADEIVQNYGYWKNGKGCCIGCLAHENDNAHKALEKQIGAPVWLSKIADAIFEGLPEDVSKIWPERFMSAIPANMKHENMEKKIKALFLIVVLKSTLESFDHDKFPEVKKSIEQSIRIWERDDIGSEDFIASARAAEWAAGTAARTAGAAEWTEWAAGAAARTAGAAARTAGAARAAEWAARAAEWAAGTAARTAGAAEWTEWAAARAAGAAARTARAAGAAKYTYFSDELVRIMEDAQ